MLLMQTLRYLPAQFFGPLFQFASMIVWTHWLAPREMGIYALVTVSQEITYLLTLSWFSQYSLRYFPQKQHTGARSAYMQTETSIVLLAGLLHLIAAFGLLLLVGDGQPGWALVAVSAGYFISRTLNVHMSERARADEHISAYTIVQTAGPVGGLLFGLAFLYLFDGGLVAVFAGYTVAQAIGGLVSMVQLKVSFRPVRPSREIMQPALRYGLPLIGVEALAWGCDHAIRYMVEYELGAAALGLLSVGWGLGLRTSAFAAMLVTAAAFPLASRMINDGRRDDAIIQLRFNAALLLGLLLPAIVGLWCIAPLFIDLLVASEYQAVTKQILPLALLVGAVRQVRYHISDQLFILDHKFSYNSIVNLTDLIVSVVLIAIGLKWYGLVGAVVGAGIAASIATSLSFYLAVSRSGFLFPYFDVLRIALAALAMGALVQAMPLTGGYLVLFAAIAVGMLSYPVFIGILMPQLSQKLLALISNRLASSRAPSNSR